MGETHSKSSSSSGRRLTRTTNLLIPPPPPVHETNPFRIDIVVYLVLSFSFESFLLSATCKRFRLAFETLNLFRHVDNIKILRHLLMKKTPKKILNPRTGLTIFHATTRPECLELLLKFYPRSFDLPSSSSNLTPLHLACINGSKSMVRLFLESGANPNATDRLGRSCLHFATFSESKIVFDELISHGARIVATAKQLNTPVHYVCMKCFRDAPSILSLLESSGANLKSTNRSGRTPLHVASLTNNIRAIEFLLERCSDTCLYRDRCGRTPFMYTLASGSLSTCSILLNANPAVLTIPDNLGRTPLHVACERDSIDLVLMLLRHGCVDVNVSDSFGVTPLHVACHGESFSTLVRFGSRLDVSDSHGLTPVHIMCARGRYDCIRDLFRSESSIFPREHSSGKHLENVDENGWTVAHFASSSNNVELLGLLIDMGCDVNLKAKDGVTPLHIASTKSVATVHLLLSCGSKPKRRANGGVTPLDIASQHDHDKIRKMLNTRLSPGGRSIRFLDRSWSRRSIESEISSSIPLKSTWKQVLFESVQSRTRQSDSRALALVTHFKMYLRRRLSTSRDTSPLDKVPLPIRTRVRHHFSMVLNDTQLFVLGERLALFVMMYKRLYENNDDVSLQTLSSEIALVSNMFSKFVRKAYPQMIDDVHGTLWTIVDTELERGIFRGLHTVLTRKCRESSEHSQTNLKMVEYMKRLNDGTHCLRLLDDLKSLNIVSRENDDDEIVISSITSKLRSSILCLGEMQRHQTPRGMLRCISDTCRMITKVTTSGHITSDTLIPILAFVIVRTTCLKDVYLKSVFMDLYMPESIRLGEAGFTFVTFQTALNHIRTIGDDSERERGE